ncbi:MAG: hypothetical protein PF961_23325, partial [Planctomycetota bacterium]|nr:hypothetical protein [Planctomycetota bacterium]
MLVIAVTATLGLSLWSMLDGPRHTLVARRGAGPGVSITLNDDVSPSRWWRVELQLDRHLRPGPAWTIDAGPADGPGHRLRWDPTTRRLHLLHRHPPGAGPGPMQAQALLLATIPLEQVPDQLHWRRRDHRISLHAGDRELGEWEDALAAPAVSTWTLVTAGDLGRGQLAIHNDTHLQTVASRDQTPPEQSATMGPAEVRALVRQALRSDASSAEGVLARERATSAVSILGSSTEPGRSLANWLDWDRGRSALAGTPDLPTLPMVDAIDELASHDTDPGPGLAVHLVPGAVWRAVRPSPKPAREGFEQQREWLRLAARSADAHTGIE